MVDRSIKLFHCVETIYKRTCIKESECPLRITHKAVSEWYKHTSLRLICDDDDISDFLSLYEDRKEITIYVMLEPRKDKGKAICIANDNYGSNFDVGGSCFVDDYFGLHI